MRYTALPTGGSSLRFSVVIRVVASPIVRDGWTAADRVVEVTQTLRTRDAGDPCELSENDRSAGEGRRCIAVIGIDRYNRGWDELDNAVNDANGVLRMFKELEFTLASEPLLDRAATHDALDRLVKDELRVSLHQEDSLIIFFAGHGHTASTLFAKQCYLIPADGAPAGGDRRTWIRLDRWLSDIAELNPKHILVILDSCHSGLILDHDIHGRPGRRSGEDVGSPLHRLVSRRVITSAYGDERAFDSGPVHGHSLFTGCLMAAIRGDLAKQVRAPFAMGDELGAYVRRRVSEHSNRRQTPRMGKLEHDEGGEFLVPLLMRPRRQRRTSTASSAHRWNAATLQQVTASSAEAVQPPDGAPARLRTEGWSLEPAFAAALDRHGAQRQRGYRVLSVISGDAMTTQTAWATWAAQHGFLTLLTDAAHTGAAIGDLLAQTPWMRCLPEARKRLAAAARLGVDEVNAALDSRGASERRHWIERVAALDRHVLVSGWLLSALRESAARVPDLRTAPAQETELLAIACDLAAPTTVLFRHAEPTAEWLEHAISTAAVLTGHMRTHSVAVAAPDALVAQVLHAPKDSNAKVMARQGHIAMANLEKWSPGRSRGRTIRVLFEALASDPRTRAHFELDGQVALTRGGPTIDVDLLAPRARIAIELDGWHHFHDPDGYRRDRMQDVHLQTAGYFVMRFLTEDVDERLAPTLDQIAIALAERRASAAQR